MVANFLVRSAQIKDVGALFQLIQALAEYEKLTHLVTGTPEQLEQHLFGVRPCIEALVAEVEGIVIGMALYFHNYSTFLTKPGIYLEDLFVLPQYRGLGIGKALLVELSCVAVARDCGRLEWTVLDWNVPSIEFYARMGADVLPDWRICRVTGDRLVEMARSADSGFVK